MVTSENAVYKDESNADLPVPSTDHSYSNNAPKENTHWTGRIKYILFSILIGQIMAVLLSSSGICAAFLQQNGLHLPFAQNLPHYLLLAITFGSLRLGACLRRRYVSTTPTGERIPPAGVMCTKRRILLCVSCGIIDVHAFWAILASYGYTTLTSIQLLDCLDIPSSMVFSYILLKHRYTWTRYVGVAICLVGACFMVGADVLSANTHRALTHTNVTTAAHSSVGSVITGDLLAIVGAMLYGLATVLQEYFTTNYGPTTYLAYMGMVAAPLCAIYCAILETNSLTAFLFNLDLQKRVPAESVLPYYFGYASSMFMLDITMAYAISKLSAVFINLSLLAADFYSLFAGLFLFHLEFHYLYFISFTMIIVGMVIFTVALDKPKDVALEYQADLLELPLVTHSELELQETNHMALV